MSTMTKVFVVLNSVLSIALSVLFISSAAQWGNWKDLIHKYQSARDAAITQRQQTAATAQAALALKDEAIASWQAKLRQTESELEDAGSKLAQATSDLAVVKNERVALEAGRTKLQEILNVSTGELKTVQKQNQDLLAQNMDLQARNSRLNSRVLELTTNVTILTDQVRNIQEKLYAAQTGGSISEPSAGGQAQAAPMGASAAETPAVTGQIHGEITQVDGTYAAINVGESSGVSAGMTFMVYRRDNGSGTYLGDLTVERVRASEAGGKLTTLAAGSIRQGDRVVAGLN